MFVPMTVRPLRVAMFKPAKVLPAPGTPVTKQIALSFFALAVSMICSSSCVVAPRFWRRHQSE
jgi:hypothetical protein